MLSTFEVSAVSYSFNGAEIAIAPFLVFLLFGLFIVVPFALFRRWLFYRRRLRKNIITAAYEPPLGFNPAEIGYMFDGKLRAREVAATIIHLQQRGYLHVKKTESGKRIYAGPRVGDIELKTYEKKLIEVADNSKGASLHDLLYRFMSYKSKNNADSVGTVQFAFTQLVHSDLQRNQYVKMSSSSAFIYRAFKIMLLLQFVLILMPLLLLWGFVAIRDGTTDFVVLSVLILFALMLSIFLLLPVFLAACVLTYLRGRIVGRDWIITPKLERLWPQIVGYRQYIKSVENDRLVFQTKELQTISRNDSLPYAVALGFVKNWRDILS